MQECVFCQIAGGELPGHKVFEDAMVLAVMDKYPVVDGQVLVMSKKHEPAGFSQMNGETVLNFVSVARKLAGKMIKGLGCREVTFMIEGLDVAHAHAKIIPVYSREDYLHRITKPGREAEDGILEINSHKIRKGE